MSLKSLLFNVLEKAIGDFIVGFTAEQLKLGLWSGDIELRDLEVNTAAVAKLGLPVAVKGGRVASLRLSIPWSKLGSQPVVIRIEGVSVVLGMERAPASWAPDELAERLGALLRGRLARSDASFAKQLEQPEEPKQNKGMVARYAGKIVDNLEVTVRDVHARFENEGTAVGVTVAALELRAANENWEPAFVDKRDHLLRNLVRLESLAVYWDRAAAPIDVDAMGALIAPRENTGLDAAYVLRPLDAALRLTRNDKDAPGSPRYRLDFETAETNLVVRCAVLRDATAVGKEVAVLQRQHALASVHPAVALGNAARPVKRSNARLWWRYAAEFACPALATARDGRGALDSSTIHKLRSRTRYMHLYEASLEADSVTVEKNQAEMRDIELSLPFGVLCTWRQTVLLKRRDLAHNLTSSSSSSSKKKDAEQANKPGLWGRMFGSTKAVEAEEKSSDEATLADLEAIARRAEEEESKAKPPPGFELARATVKTGCRVALYDADDAMVAEFGLELSAFARTTADGDEIDVAMGVGEMFARDATGRAAESGILDARHCLVTHEEVVGDDAPLRALSAMATTIKDKSLKTDTDALKALADERAPVQLVISRRPLMVGKERQTRLDVVARARSFRIAYHAPTIAHLLQAFKPPPEERKAIERSAGEARAAASEYALRAATTALETLHADDEGAGGAVAEGPIVFKVFVDARLGAPRVVLPRSWTKPEGAFVVDTGAIIVDGGIDAREARRQRWSLDVKEARITRLDQHLVHTADVIAPFTLSLVVGLNGPRSPEPPLALDLAWTPLLLTVAPSTLRELLELAALLAGGLKIDDDDDEDEVIIEELDDVTVDEPSDDDGTDVLAAVRGTTQKTTFRLRAKLPLIELKAASLCARIDSLNVDLAIKGGDGGLALDAKLRGISLVDQNAGVSIIETCAATDSIESARCALEARRQLPITDTAVSSKDDALLTISLVTKKPISEDDAATEVCLSFSTLRANCGAATLLPLQPLVSALFTGLAAFSTNGKAAPSQNVARQQTESPPGGGLRVIATIGEVSAALLDETGAAPVGRAALRGTAILWATKPSGAKTAAVRVAAFAIEDARAFSNAAYSRVVVPKDNGGNEMLARIDFLEDDAGRKDIAVLVRPVSLYVLPEPMYASINAALALVKSLGTVFSASPPPPSSDDASVAPVQTQPPPVASALSLKVDLPEAEVILVRDAALRDSEALMLGLGAHVTLTTVSRGGTEGGEMNVAASVSGLAVRLAEDGLVAGSRSPLLLLDPTNASVKLERQLDGAGDAFFTNVGATLSQVDARVSYRDILAVLAMLTALRPSITKTDDVATTEESQQPPQQQKPQATGATAAGVKVATLQAAITFEGARATLVDDSLGASVPLLKLKVGTLTGNLAGPTTNLNGEATCTFEAASFNRACLVYEPIIREFTVKVSTDMTRDVETGATWQNIAVATDQVLDVVCSTAFVADLAHLSARLKQEALATVENTQAKIVKAVRDAPPLLVANDTELALRCRVSDDETAWIDLPPGGRVSVAKSTTAASIGGAGLSDAPPFVDIANVPRQTPDLLLSRLVSNMPHRSLRKGLGSAHGLANGVSWHVSFDDDTGRVLAKLQSRVVISNRTPLAFEVATTDSKTVATALPGKATPAPLDLARRTARLVLRRADPGHSRWGWTSGEFALWGDKSSSDESAGDDDEGATGRSTNDMMSSMAASVAGAAATGVSTLQPKAATKRESVKKRLVSTSGRGVPTHHVVVGVARVPSSSTSSIDDEARLVLASPLVIRSKVPCGVVLTLATADAEARLRISPGEEVGCCDLDVAKNGVWLACRVADFRGKCDTKLTVKNAAKTLPPANADFMSAGLFALTLRRDGAAKQRPGHKVEEDDSNDTLQLELRVERKHRGLGLALTLSCPLWIIDKTGLGLAFSMSPPQVIDQIASSFFGEDAGAKSSPRQRKSRHLSGVPEDDEAGEEPDSRQQVPATLLGNAVTVLVASDRPHALARAARAGDFAYAEGQATPYSFYQTPPGPLASAVRLMTYDGERAGASNNGPAIFNKMAQQHQQRMRRAGLESQAAKDRREARYITLRNTDPNRTLEIFVAVDARAERPPEWLLDGGAFARAPDVGSVHITRKRGPLSFKKQDEVRQYAVFRAEAHPTVAVDLGPNDDQAMYLVFAKFREQPVAAPPVPDTSVEEQTPAAAVILDDKTSHNDSAAGEWLQNNDRWSWPGVEWLGRSGATLLCSNEGKFAINRTAARSAWSSKLAVGGSSFPVTMDDGSNGCLELDVRPSPLRGAFANLGTLVEIAPRYAVWNVDTSYVIFVRQKGTSSPHRLEPHAKRGMPWHWCDRKQPRELEFGVLCDNGADEECWSLGSVPTTSLSGYALMSSSKAGLVFRVEVALTEDLERPPYESVVVYVSVERLETALFTARNESSPTCDVVVAQNGSVLARVPPGDTRILGFAAPLAAHRVEVSVEGRSKKPTMVDLDAVRAETPLVGTTDLGAGVNVVEGTRVLHVGPRGLLSDDDFDEVQGPGTTRTLSINVAGLGLSFVSAHSDQPRAELAYARLSQATVVFRSDAAQDNFEFKVTGFQLDNHVPKALWPTFVAASLADPTDAAAIEGEPLVSVAAVQARHKDGSSTLRYFAARVLPLDIHADLSSLLALGDAVASVPLELLNADEALAAAHPADWASDVSRRIRQRNRENNDDDESRLATARRCALRPRGYVEALMLHPMEATISFEPTPTEENEIKLSFLAYVQTLATISKASVKLNSFIVEKAVESPGALVSRIVKHYVLQALSQLHRIVGSLASIGSPVNLVDTIGSGAKEFFYAPARGVVESPSAFATGVYKGTTGLVGGVVSGVTSSVAGIGNAVSHNVSLLSGDKEYVAEREARRRQFAAESGGATAGVIAGGTSVARGIAEGVSGIFLKPIEGAQKGGALGAVKGLAQGIAGVAVKPVVGVVDGVGNVLQGVSQTVSNAQVTQNLRPPLPLEQIPDSDQYYLPMAAPSAPPRSNSKSLF